jgi:protein SCO1/2
MKSETRRAALAAALRGVVLPLVLLAPALIGAESRWGANYFPNVPLTTQDGKDVRFYDLIKGKIVAIDLIYTNCQYSCPLETARLARMQQLLGDRMGREVFFISISIDPEHDTPAALKAYAAKYDAGPGWTFLTGKMTDIDTLSKKLGLWSDPTQTQDGHTPMLLIGNEATGQWTQTSALDNPAYTARILTDWMTSWKGTKPGASYANAPAIGARDEGEYQYRSLCANCHSVGQGDRIGPDLGAALGARDRGWLTEYIVHPDVLRARKDPIAMALSTRYGEVRMPNLGLTAAEAQSILRYLDTKRASGTSAAQAAPASGVAAGTAPASSAATRSHGLTDPALAIQSALAHDTVAGVSAQAIVLRDAATAAHVPAVATAAADLARQTTLADARRAFGVVSDALVTYTHAHPELRAAGLRVAYCPMVRKSWLQKNGPLENPYYGSRMLSCGEFTE